MFKIEPADGKVNSDVVRVCLLFSIVLGSCLGNGYVVNYGMACRAKRKGNREKRVKEKRFVLRRNGRKEEE